MGILLFFSRVFYRQILCVGSPFGIIIDRALNEGGARMLLGGNVTSGQWERIWDVGNCARNESGTSGRCTSAIGAGVRRDCKL